MKHWQQDRTHKVTAAGLDGLILWQSDPASHTQLECAYGSDQIPF